MKEGSPPRMRGKRMKEAERDGYLGITPADAGKTVSVKNNHIINGDHPRGCGENALFQAFSVRHLGSPPRMRGKPLKYLMVFKRERITPADAGKTNMKQVQTRIA